MPPEPPQPRRAPDAERRRTARWRALRACGVGYLLLGAICTLVLGSCCATKRLWRGADDAPTRLVAAAIDGRGTLSAALQHESGETFVLEADLGEPDGRWSQVTARRAGTYTGSLAPTAHPIDIGASTVRGRESISVRHLRTVDASSNESHTLWVEGRGHLAVVHCPAPVDWGSGAAYLAVALTPVTLAVDVVSSPIHIAWIFATAGGHGDPWLPWCGD